MASGIVHSLFIFSLFFSQLIGIVSWTNILEHKCETVSLWISPPALINLSTVCSKQKSLPEKPTSPTPTPCKELKHQPEDSAAQTGCLNAISGLSHCELPSCQLHHSSQCLSHREQQYLRLNTPDTVLPPFITLIEFLPTSGHSCIFPKKLQFWYLPWGMQQNTHKNIPLYGNATANATEWRT